MPASTILMQCRFWKWKARTGRRRWWWVMAFLVAVMVVLVFNTRRWPTNLRTTTRQFSLQLVDATRDARCATYCGASSSHDINLPWSTELGPRDVVIVVDFINNWHWCPSALRRIYGMREEMFDFLDVARSHGALILHAVSDNKMHYLEDTDVLPFVRRSGIQSNVLESAVMPAAARDWKLVDRRELCQLSPAPPLSLALDEVCGDSGKSMFADKNKEDSISRKPTWMKGLNVSRLAHPDIIAAQRDAIFSVLKERNPRRILFAGVHLELCILYSRWFSVLRMMKSWEFHENVRFGILVPLVDISDTQPSPQLDRDWAMIWRMAAWIKCVAVRQIVGEHRVLDLVTFAEMSGTTSSSSG